MVLGDTVYQTANIDYQIFPPISFSDVDGL